MPAKRLKSQDSRLLYISMVAMLVSGTGISVITQYQNRTLGYEGKPWSHPFWQSFVAQAFHMGGFIVYYCSKKKVRGKKAKAINIRKESAFTEADESLYSHTYDDSVMSPSRLNDMVSMHN